MGASQHLGGSSGGGGDMITKVLGKIMGGLFKSSGQQGRTRDLEFDGDNDDVLGGFDDSNAVQKVVAEHYYRHVYRKNMDLRQATPQTLGGAAAIKALRSEERMVHQLRYSELAMPPDLHHDQMVMGLAMSEAADLLERKSELGPLHPDDNLENIGQIALATIIKIKIDEDNAHSGYDARAQSTGMPAHRSRSRRHDGHHQSSAGNGHSHARHNYDRNPPQDPYAHYSSGSGSHRQSTSNSGHRQSTSNNGHRQNTGNGHRQNTTSDNRQRSVNTSGHHRTAAANSIERRKTVSATNVRHTRKPDPYAH
ncbi:hypothetical protein IWW51_005542 [Coemansia sp. RSA 2702]|nr:hypothetical protein IWW54_006327 [Coemansia sp. RSA 2705]KAJ2306534.1 hypothetical protein IWW52_006207 [Coemansia sp. RSA 2704]KAJ2316777.1 hypothetical protein IWW51_005542 [Coemansia sp. RSA 2702]KAJ2712682.1 hypothetical protein H4R23_006107 [Coemansia sp. Cherry 401B]